MAETIVFLFSEFIISVSGWQPVSSRQETIWAIVDPPTISILLND